MGVSEIFASITSLEFFYSQAPLSMKSVMQSLNLFMTALGTHHNVIDIRLTYCISNNSSFLTGSWFTIPLLILVNCDTSNEWVPANLDDGHLGNETIYLYI